MSIRILKFYYRIFAPIILLAFLPEFEPKKTFAQVPTLPPASDASAPKLALSDIIRQVEENHPKITGANIERGVAEAKLLEKKGAFDPAFSTANEFLRYNSTSTPGKAAFAFHNQGTVEWATRSGMKFFAGGRGNFGKVKSPFSQTGELGEYFAGVAMPLFRDRNVNEKSIAEKQARLGVNVSETAITAVRLKTVREASESYWDWTAAKQKLAVNQNLFEIASQRAAQIASRVASGDLPPIDSTEAALEVQRRISGVVKARRDLQKAGLKLGLYLWKSNGEPEDALTPEQAPDKFPTPNPLPDFVVKEGLERALKNHPELERLQIVRNQNELEAQLARNNRRPRVDLYIAPGRDNGFNSVGTTFKFGAAVELPMRTRTADGQFAAAQLKIEKNILEMQAQRQAIITEVTDAAQAVNAAHDGYLLALQELELARTLERGERQRFAVGDSTLFLVNQRERGSAEAEIKLIDTQAIYEQALIAFKIATLRY